MAIYTELQQNDVATLARSYSLGDVVNFSPLEGGSANSNYRVNTSKGLYIFSVCDEKDVASIDALTQVLLTLAEADFPTTRLVRTTEGERFTEYDGKPLIVKEFIEGEVPDRLNEGQLYSLGSLLGKLNTIEVSAPVPTTFPYGLESFVQVYDRTDTFTDWLKSQDRRIQGGIPAESRKSFIHGDIFCDNLVVEGDHIKAVLDFEEGCNYFQGNFF